MLGFILISQNGRAVKPYGKVAGGMYTTTNMKVSLYCLLALVSVSVIAATEDEYSSDLGPEDYYIDQVANRPRLVNEALFGAPNMVQMAPENKYEMDSEDYPGFQGEESKTDFTFEVPSKVEEEDTKFAVRPPHPLYYHDTRGTEAKERLAKLQHKPVKYQSHGADDDTFQVPRPGDVTFAPAHTENDLDGEETEDSAKDAQQNSRAQVIQTPVHGPDDKTDIYFIAIVAGCSAAAVVGVIVIGVSWYKLQKNAKLAADVEYPAYGVTGPNKETSPTGDRKLAHSAQMYHYQHQKQQIIAMESQAASERNGSVSEAESDEENEEGDYTVYECPGLAPTGEMEVKNPLFLDDPTPATPAPANQNKDSTSGGLTNK